MPTTPTPDHVALLLTQGTAWIDGLARLDTWTPERRADVLAGLQGCPLPDLPAHVEDLRRAFADSRERHGVKPGHVRTVRPPPGAPPHGNHTKPRGLARHLSHIAATPEPTMPAKQRALALDEPQAAPDHPKPERAPFQVMPDLTPEEYAALREDIAARGVLVAVEYDEAGNVLDGHHRVRICEELGIADWPRIVRTGMSEEQKRTHARTLNLSRRQLTREQRRKLIATQLCDTPEKSDRQVAKALGVNHETVGAARRELEGRGEIRHVSQRTDTKGRNQPAVKLTERERVLKIQELRTRRVAAKLARLPIDTPPKRRIDFRTSFLNAMQRMSMELAHTAKLRTREELSEAMVAMDLSDPTIAVQLAAIQPLLDSITVWHAGRVANPTNTLSLLRTLAKARIATLASELAKDPATLRSVQSFLAGLIEAAENR